MEAKPFRSITAEHEAISPEEHPSSLRVVGSWLITLALVVVVAVLIAGAHAVTHPNDCCALPTTASRGGR